MKKLVFALVVLSLSSCSDFTCNKAIEQNSNFLSVSASDSASAYTVCRIMIQNERAHSFKFILLERHGELRYITTRAPWDTSNIKNLSEVEKAYFVEKGDTLLISSNGEIKKVIFKE